MLITLILDPEAQMCLWMAEDFHKEWIFMIVTSHETCEVNVLSLCIHIGITCLLQMYRPEGPDQHGAVDRVSGPFIHLISLNHSAAQLFQLGG